MKKLFFALLMLFVTTISFANAGGGMEKNPWQPVNVDGGSAFLPSGLNEENCEFLHVSQAGKTYLCDGGEAFGEFTYFVPVSIPK